MRTYWLIVLLTTLPGCATAWDRERQCFYDLIPEYLAAQNELLELESAWRGTWNVEAPADGTARRRLQDARARLGPTLAWYERLYDRLLLRSEEDEMLAETRLLLFTGPAALFYPVVRWNLHEVLWDGADPDADSDLITRYCAERLAAAAISDSRREANRNFV